jgi:hypothetical protein
MFRLSWRSANWIRSAESNRVFASQLLLMGILIPKLGENNRKIVEAGFRFLPWTNGSNYCSIVLERLGFAGIDCKTAAVAP